jgi:multisubunit Na+/H+ antiporter MnhF subunit
MSDTLHPLAPHELPGYLSAADGSDGLMTMVIIFLFLLMLVVGNFYFKLHALPERMAHRKSHTQLQIITVLALLALFTHNNIFWVAALLLAVVKFPDYITPLNSIAKSLAALAKDTRAEEVIKDNGHKAIEVVTEDEGHETEEKENA